MATNPYQTSDSADSATPKKISGMLIVVGIIGTLIVVVPLGLCAGILELIRAEGRAAHEQYLREKTEIAPVLASDPAFKDLEEREYSGGGAYITGRVDHQEDIENLWRRLATRLGEQRADELVRGIHTHELDE